MNNKKQGFDAVSALSILSVLLVVGLIPLLSESFIALEFGQTSDYGSYAIQFSVFILAAIMTGALIVLRTRRGERRRMIMIMLGGVLLTVVSMVWVGHDSSLNSHWTQAGLPFPWLVHVDTPTTIANWIPSPGVAFDVLFWSGVLLALAEFRRGLMALRKSPETTVPGDAYRSE